MVNNNIGQLEAKECVDKLEVKKSLAVLLFKYDKSRVIINSTT